LPELYVLHTDSDELVRIGWIETSQENFILVRFRRRQLLAPFPVPYDHCVVVIKSNRGQLFAIAFAQALAVKTKNAQNVKMLLEKKS